MQGIVELLTCDMQLIFQWNHKQEEIPLILLRINHFYYFLSSLLLPTIYNFTSSYNAESGFVSFPFLICGRACNLSGLGSIVPATYLNVDLYKRSRLCSGGKYEVNLDHNYNFWTSLIYEWNHFQSLNFSLTQRKWLSKLSFKGHWGKIDTKLLVDDHQQCT